MEQTNATFLPLFEFTHSQPGLSDQNATVQFPDFPTVYETLFDTGDGEVGSPVEISSWLLPKDVIQTDKPEDLAAELLKTEAFGYG